MIRPDFQDVHIMSMQNERAAQRLAEGWAMTPAGPGVVSRLAARSGSLLIELGARLQRWADVPAQSPVKASSEVACQ